MSTFVAAPTPDVPARATFLPVPTSDVRARMLVMGDLGHRLTPAATAAAAAPPPFMGGTFIGIRVKLYGLYTPPFIVGDSSILFDMKFDLWIQFMYTNSSAYKD